MTSTPNYCETVSLPGLSGQSIHQNEPPTPLENWIRRLRGVRRRRRTALSPVIPANAGIHPSPHASPWHPKTHRAILLAMSARPPKYDWPIKWPSREAMTKDRLGLILFVATLATVIPALWVIVSFYGALFSGDDEAIRNIGLIFLAVLGAPFVIWRAVVAQGNLDRSKDRDYADLFTKAVEQLGATRDIKRIVKIGELNDELEFAKPEETTEPNIEVRLGAIYALERISQDSERDHISAMEVLCAYIRENAPAREAKNLPISFLPLEKIPNRDVSWWNEYVKLFNDWKKLLPHPRSDVRAALSVICRRSTERINYEMGYGSDKPQFVIDLKDTNLQNSDLSGAHLENALLDRSRLDGANLSKARFERARFRESIFDGAECIGTTFYNAGFHSARLIAVNCSGANFNHAALVGCAGINANFFAAKLNAAKIVHSNFEASRFVGAEMYKANFFNSWIYCVDYSDALACSATFRGATGLLVSQIDSFFGCAATSIPDDLENERPEHWLPEPVEKYEDMRGHYLEWRRSRTDSAGAA